MSKKSSLEIGRTKSIYSEPQRFGSPDFNNRRYDAKNVNDLIHMRCKTTLYALSTVEYRDIIVLGVSDIAVNFK